MHCFIPYSQYTNDIHIKVVSLMKGELIKKGTPCMSIATVVGKDESGIHFYSWNDFDKESGVVDYDPEEPITGLNIEY